jgi:hypothetical protein
MTMFDIIWYAVEPIPLLEQADADRVIDAVIERIIKVLRKDPRMPALCSDDYRVLFADVAARTREETGALINGKVDLAETVEAIVEALAVEAREDPALRKTGQCKGDTKIGEPLVVIPLKPAVEITTAAERAKEEAS